MGQRGIMTPTDILKLNRMYDCDSNTGKTLSMRSNGVKFDMLNKSA